MKYKVKFDFPLNIKGKRYEKGDELPQLPAQEALRLVRYNVIEEVKEDKKETKKAKEPTAAEEYEMITNEKPDGRWSKERLQEEVKKAKDKEKSRKKPDKDIETR